MRVLSAAVVLSQVKQSDSTPNDGTSSVAVFPTLLIYNVCRAKFRAVLGERRLQLDRHGAHHPQAHDFRGGGARHKGRGKRPLPVRVQEGRDCRGGGMTPPHAHAHPVSASLLCARSRHQRCEGSRRDR